MFIPFLILLSVGVASGAEDEKQPTTRDQPDAPVQRALAFLGSEVPQWSRDNKCYSCHNNGDAARALYQAQRLSLRVAPTALDDTTRWLSRPAGWDRNGGDGPSNDRQLATLQFAAALAAARDAGLLKDHEPLLKAAQRVAEYQRKDGSWRIDADGTLGSPATYGTCLATAMACRVLHAAGAERFGAALGKAERWLQTFEVKSVLDAGAVLLALAELNGQKQEFSKEAARQQKACLDLIRNGEAKEGGWGPYVTSPSEPFDTAVVLLALARHAGEPDVKPMLRRGRAYLVSVQNKDGSWPETTRPPGAESYAQRLSTTGWATQALLTLPKE